MTYSPHIPRGTLPPTPFYPGRSYLRSFPIAEQGGLFSNLGVGSSSSSSSSSSYVDPTLERDPSSGSFATSWNPPQVQRFLKEPNPRTAFLASQPIMHSQSGSLLQASLQASGVVPSGPPVAHRRSSPFASDPSCTDSTALSPPGDNDCFQPATPPDIPTMSPYGFDQWDPQAHACQFTGIGAHDNTSYVRPFDVNPSQEPQVDCYDHDTGPAVFSLIERTLSFDSHASQCDSNHSSQSYPTSFSNHRMASPDDAEIVVMDEIHIPEHFPSPSYSSPSDEGDGTGMQDPLFPTPKDDDRDADFPPTKTHEPKLPSSSARPQRRKRSLAGSSNPPQSKRAKNASPTSRNKTAYKAPRSEKPDLECSECDHSPFKDESSLESHMKKQHTRPFVCVFHFAGCDSNFASKNEWKRHVSSQHLLLNYWLCDQDACAKVSNSPASTPKGTSRSAADRGHAHQREHEHGHEYEHDHDHEHEHDSTRARLPNGAIFNRKDLYTQHLRRMHTPPNIKKQMMAKKPVPEWEKVIRVLQMGAIKDRCTLPGQMACPARGCAVGFSGTDAWDQRMEHVAKHLERAAAGQEDEVVFGGETDPTLMRWATRPDIDVVRTDADGEWRLHNPLRKDSNASAAAAARSAAIRAHAERDDELLSGEEDAEGEDDY